MKIVSDKQVSKLVASPLNRPQDTLWNRIYRRRLVFILFLSTLLLYLNVFIPRMDLSLLTRIDAFLKLSFLILAGVLTLVGIVACIKKLLSLRRLKNPIFPISEKIITSLKHRVANKQ